jgi:NADPH oxidase 1
VPKISPLQWHPFTITSSPFDALHSIHFRVVGDFTRKLANTINEVGHVFHIKVDGPFGAPASDVFSYDKVVMIAGGIGVTPWISILRTLFHAGRDGPRRVQSACLIWSCGQIETLAAFVPFLKSLEKEFCDDTTDIPFLKVEIYVTQTLSEDEKQSIILNAAGALRDPHTDLQSMLNFYRPHYEKIMSEMKASVLHDQIRKADVGVFFCGPAPAARVIQAACKKVSGHGISFAFRQEQF